MAGETVKTEAICLNVSPWSRTSHIVVWLTPEGKVATAVKGAVRPKSFFLGQYDENYTCQIVYYSRARGSLHALRECFPLDMRPVLRENFRAVALAGYFRSLVRELSVSGPDCRPWYDLLGRSLSAVAGARDEEMIPLMLSFELEVLGLLGLSPALSSGNGVFELRGERVMPLSAEVARCLKDPLAEKNRQILLDAARVIGVFYKFHVDCASQVRRTVLMLISNNKQGSIPDEH